MTDDESMPSRRFFLKATGQAIFVAPWLARRLLADPQQEDSELSPLMPNRKSVVVRSRSESVCAKDHRVRKNILVDMLNNSLNKFCQTQDVKQAWHSILQEDDMIGIKCDPLDDSVIKSLMPMLQMLILSLTKSGWPAERIVVSDVAEDVVRSLGVKPAPFGWTEQEVDFGSGKDHLSAFLDQVTAIINVPTLKSDNILGISGCLKNMTYQMVKHPAKYHENGGAPFLADILALPEIQKKLKLNIVNGVRSVYRDGPLANEDNVRDCGLLLLGIDPIAVDVSAAEELNIFRQKEKLSRISIDEEHFPALFDASRKGLGNVNFRRIERLTADET